MSIFTSLQQRLGFTRNEARAILFLSVVFLAGLGLRWYQDIAPGSRLVPFEYQAADSAFATRRASLAIGLPQMPGVPPQKPARKPALAPRSVRVNSAGRSQLMALPGIGGAYADRILAYRAAHGRFQAMDELLHIKGIGRKRLEQLRPFIVLD